MVVTFTFLLAFIVVLVGCTISYVKITNPEADISTAVSSLTSVVSAMLAALLGLVAGKSDALNTTQTRPGKKERSTVYERPEEE